MSEKIEQQYPSELSQVYAQLNQQDVEQFYTSYQGWKIQQQILALQAEIDTLRQQIDENAQYMQEVRPPAVSLATLARLQASGVHDLDLLDRMLERGEGWLDLIVQRLDYCEQLEFIHDNYTQWCEHALEGAYDWIDSMRGADAWTLSSSSSDIVDHVSAGATEALLLRKLTSEEEEDNAETLLPDEAVAEVDSPQITQAEQQSPLSLQIPQTPLPAGAAEPAQELLLQDLGSAQWDSEFQDGDFAPALEIQLPTGANAEADFSQDTQVEHAHSPGGTSYAEDQPQEAPQQETEISLLVETNPLDDASLVTEEQHPEQQTVEPALAVDALLPRELDAVDEPAHVSEALEQAAEFARALNSSLPTEIEAEANPSSISIEQQVTLEDPSFSEGSVEADSAQVPIDQVASPEDTSVSATQETPLPTGADESAASDEPHNDQAAETVTASEASHPVDTNVESTSPVELPTPAGPINSMPIDTNVESTSPLEEIPEAVHAAQESDSQEHIAPAPASKAKSRGFWQWLLALFRN